MVENIKYDTKNKKFLPRIWSMWREYYDVRIMSGKVFPDIIVLFILLVKKIYQGIITLFRSIYNLPPIKIIRFFGSKLLLIEGIKIFVYALLDGLVLWGKYYYAFFIIFTIAFSSIFILLRSLQDSIGFFFIIFLPLLLLNGFSLAILFYFIDRKEKGETLSLFKAFQACLTQIMPITLTSLFHVFFTIELIVFFFMFGLVLSTYFDALAYDWRTSILFWFFVITFGFIILVALFVFNILSYQAFFYASLEKKPIMQALQQAKQLVIKYLSQFLVYYLLLLACYIPFLYLANTNFSDVGFALIILFYSQSVVFFSFLLRRRFIGKNTQEANLQLTPQSGISKYLFVTLFLIGMISYALSAWFIIQVYPRAVQVLKQHYEETVILQNLVPYENPSYGYSIDYPGLWSSYEWGDNAITFAGNYNETPAGFLSITITVSPIEESDFDQFFKSKPGLLYYDQDTKDIMTKTSNMIIQDADTVKFTSIKNGTPFTEYQTHYLVRREDNVYDISFTTRSKEIEKANERLFNKIIDSFRFK